VSLPKYSKRPEVDSILESFKPYLLARIESAKPHWIPAEVLLREIKPMGYLGFISKIKIYIREFKAAPIESVVRFETQPSQQL
jgi:transposase